MRINDGSICNNCKHFEHDCDLDNGCIERCGHFDEKIRDIFVDDYEKVLTECSGYKIS